MRNAEAARTHHIPSSMIGVLSQYGLRIILVLLVVTFSLTNRYFLTVDNLLNIAEQNVPLAIVAVAITFAVISGNIDLSPGSLIALTGMVIGLTLVATNSIGVSILIGLASSILVGALNGCLVALTGINAVVVTLAAMIWTRGLALALAGGDSIVVRDPLIDFFNTGRILGLPLSVLLLIPVYLMGWFLLNKTKLGRYTYALGGSEPATRLAGVNTAAYKTLIFTFTGLMTGIAATISVTRVASAQPNVAMGLELDAIIAAVIGGNSLNGGEGSLGKTLIGVLFIAILGNGLSSLGLTDSYYYFIKGTIILIALLVDVIARQIKRPPVSSKGPA